MLNSPNPAQPHPRQVDALKMEAFIDSFVEGLGLDQGYTMIVVNPKWSAQLASYGFRAGFSNDELEMLQRQVGLRRRELPGDGQRLEACEQLLNRPQYAAVLCGGTRHTDNMTLPPPPRPPGPADAPA